MLRPVRMLILMISVVSISFFVWIAPSAQEHSYVPPDGFVPNKETAIRIAAAVWIPIYGEDNIKKQAPYNTQLVNGAWIVTGTLPKNSIGGVAYIELLKKDGRILRVSHGE